MRKDAVEFEENTEHLFDSCLDMAANDAEVVVGTFAADAAGALGTENQERPHHRDCLCTIQ